MERYKPFIGICDFCYPEMMVASCLRDEKDKLSVVVDIDGEYTCVCISHMLEIVSSMAAMGQSELRKSYDSVL